MSCTAQKMKFYIEDFFNKCDQISRSHLVTFPEEILSEKLHYMCRAVQSDLVVSVIGVSDERGC